MMLRSVIGSILASLNLAANMWGLYWPVEYWVMGLDPEAGEELVDKFCSGREEATSGTTSRAWPERRARNSIQ